MSAVETERHVPLEAAFNFRDLGGYATGDGRVTRWRTAFRADGLHRLTEGDVEVMRRIGLRTVIDLRTEGELAERGRFPLDAHPVGFHHLSLMDVMWEPGEAPEADSAIAEFLTRKYLEMAGSAAERIAVAFGVLAEPGALPAVFHSAAGKDRTGIVAGLLLSSLGVADADVVADYALTREAVVRMRAWAEVSSPETIEALASAPSAFLAADPAAMAGLLELIAAEHGSTRDYVQSLGVTDDVFAALESALLEPA